MTKIILAILLYFFATLGYFYGEAQFVKTWISGDHFKAVLWLIPKVIAIPMYAVGTLWLYQYGKTWSITEFPYWIMSIFISCFFYSSILKTGITWRECIGAMLILAAAFLIGTKN